MEKRSKTDHFGRDPDFYERIFYFISSMTS